MFPFQLNETWWDKLHIASYVQRSNSYVSLSRTGVLAYLLWWISCYIYVFLTDISESLQVDRKMSGRRGNVSPWWVPGCNCLERRQRQRWWVHTIAARKLMVASRSQRKWFPCLRSRDLSTHDRYSLLLFLVVFKCDVNPTLGVDSPVGGVI